MKRGFIILWIAVLAAALTSCQLEKPIPTPGDGSREALTLRLEVEEITTGVQSDTRATIPAEAGETQINSLYLLFYANKSDGSGEHVKTLTAADLTGTLAMNGTYEIPFTDGLSSTEAYTILALANLTPNGTDVHGYLDGQSESQFIGLLEEMTEKQAVERTTITVSGVDVVEADDSRAIQSHNLFMSARVVRDDTEDTVSIRLTRGVARFDVYLDPSLDAGYNLVSASVWGAAPQAPVWYDKLTSTPARMRRFFGVKNVTGFEDESIVGRLYALENFVANPEVNDQVTTCVILGLYKNSGDGAGETYYYRVNVHTIQASQDLKRNHVYKIRVNSVEGLGADNEYSAWSQSRTQLSVSVNEWNVDDNGMVLTDGVNTMVMPVKLIRLDALGDIREYSIFTIGEETLTISRNELPAGVTAQFFGSLLRITATAMGQAELERRGSIEISYGGLRGAISVIQAPDESRYLTLNRYDVPTYAPLGRGGTSDNVPFTVEASGPWTAKIYNMDDDLVNPGFSFSPSALQSTLRSAQNPFGNTFQVYTTGDNTSNSDVRNGFVVISLDEDPNSFSRVVVLTQSPKTEIIVTPALPATLRFSPVGVPNEVNGATAADGFVFDIDPGMSGGTPNAWSITAGSGDTQYFDIEKISVGTTNRFIVRAKGTTATPYPYPENGHKHMNLEDHALQATFSIQVGSSTVPFVVAQDKMAISVSTEGIEVPEVGGSIDGVKVNIDPTLHWEAAIMTNYTVQNAEVSRPHRGHLVLNGAQAGETIDTPQTPSTLLSVGFDKLHYPLVGESPKVTVKVWLSENEGVSTTFTVTQAPLVGAPMNILDVRNEGYGSLTGGTHYLAFYRDYLAYAPMFGPTGRVKTATAIKKEGRSGEPGTISSDYVYLHVGGHSGGSQYTQARHNSVNEWWAKYGKERLIGYFTDEERIFDGRFQTVMSQLGIEGDYDPAGTPMLNTNSAVTGSSVYKYIVQHGPFGPSGTFGSTYIDGVNTAVNVSKLTSNPKTSHAVPLIVDPTGQWAYLLVDPENNLVYVGESQMFDIYIEAPAITLRGGSTHNYANLSRFLANFQAYILNAAQYGTHFTDLFLEGNEELYDDAFVD